MLRSASAFGVHTVLIVGNKKNTAFFGSQGAHKHVKMVTFDRLGDAVAHAKSLGATSICGVEICDGALPVCSSQAFSGSTAFIMGNEGYGMTEAQMEVCDRFVYIPHFGAGTASLNVTVAASIIFHRFAEWAGYQERERSGHKFVVAKLRVKAGAETQEDMKLQQHRRAQREEQERAANDAVNADALGALFLDE